MTDLEITKKCAEMMGLNYRDGFIVHGQLGEPYDPLRDDAQAMALVKKFRLDIRHGGDGGVFEVWDSLSPDHCFSESEDLNRAICECVANLPTSR